MGTVIYAFNAHPVRYVGQIGKERFIKAVAKDAGLPEERVRAQMRRSRDVADLELTYKHFHKVLKHNGWRVLRVL